MIRIITIDREYGSGANEIARKLAEQLGWKLWDQALTTEIAKVARCPFADVEAREERRDPLFHTLFKGFMHGSFEGNINTQPVELLDSEHILKITHKLIDQAASEGRCVIVGRGAPYRLQERGDTFHVFIYAPDEEKIRRLKQAGNSKEDARALIQSVDRDRAAFIKKYFGKEWPNRHLFHMMINSEVGDEAVVENVLAAVSAMDRRHSPVRAI